MVLETAQGVDGIAVMYKPGPRHFDGVIEASGMNIVGTLVVNEIDHVAQGAIAEWLWASLQEPQQEHGRDGTPSSEEVDLGKGSIYRSTVG